MEKKMEDKNETWEILKDGNLVCEGDEWECYAFLLDHQPQSTHWAQKYDGWTFRKKEESVYAGTSKLSKKKETN